MAEQTESPILPAHIEETIRSIARLHADHQQSATPLQRAVERLTAVLGRPAFIAVLTVLVGCWLALNLATHALRLAAPPDPPPFNGLAMVVSLAALYVTLLILTTQRREDELAQLREQLTLELAIMNEQKTAKMIALLEELRRDHPNLPDRVDNEAEDMAKPAEPQSVLEAIKGSDDGGAGRRADRRADSRAGASAPASGG